MGTHPNQARDRQAQEILMQQAAANAAQQAIAAGGIDIPKPGIPLEITAEAPGFTEWTAGHICLLPDKGPSTMGAIATPELAKMQQNTGIVLATCEGAPCAVGDRILVTKIFPLMSDGKLCFITRVADVVAVERKKEPESLKLAE